MSDGVSTQKTSELTLLQEVRGAAVAGFLACFRLHKVPPATPHPDALIELRDRLLYRAVSLDLHRKLITTQQAGFTQNANQSFPRVLNDPLFLVNSRIVLTSLFDDVLFNAISFFDYLGNFAGYVYLGPRGQKLKWKGCVESARGPSDSPLISSGVATLMLSENRRWVGRLQSVRGGVIHYGASLGEAGMTTTWGEKGFQVTLSFEVPESLVKQVPFLRKAKSPLLLDRAATLVTDETLRTGLLILKQIAEKPRIWQS
jgi:hypothetical protein